MNKVTNFFKNNKQLFILSLPIFVELFLQLLVGYIDQFMLSHYSQNAVSAVGNSNQIINIAIIAINTTCTATTILISQYLGANKKEKVSEVSTVSSAFIVLCSIIISSILFIFPNQIFNILSLPSELLIDSKSYLLIVGGFIVVQGLYMNLTAILKAYKFTKEVMIASVIMNILNIIGNAILINGYFGLPRLGIIGAGISTDISKTIGLIIVICFLRKKVDAKLSFKYLVPSAFDSLAKLLRVGIPACLESLSYNVSQTFIMKFINTLGTSVIATKVFSSMFATFAYAYTLAISQAAQILVGYLIGEKKKSEISKRVWSTLFISIFVSLSLTFVLYINSDFVFGFFTDDPIVLELGKKILFVEFFLEIGRSVNIVMNKTLVAAGDIKAPTIVGIIFQWGVSVVFSYILGIRLEMGLVGIWIAMAMDECIRGIIFVIRFLSGAWLKKKDLT